MTKLMNKGAQHSDIFCTRRIGLVFGLLRDKGVFIEAVPVFRINSTRAIFQGIHVIKKVTVVLVCFFF